VFVITSTGSFGLLLFHRKYSPYKQIFSTIMWFLPLWDLSHSNCASSTFTGYFASWTCWSTTEHQGECLELTSGRDITQVDSQHLLTADTRVQTQHNVGFVVDRVPLGQYFDLLWPILIYYCFHFCPSTWLNSEPII